MKDHIKKPDDLTEEKKPELELQQDPLKEILMDLDEEIKSIEASDTSDKNKEKHKNKEGKIKIKNHIKKITKERDEKAKKNDKLSAVIIKLNDEIKKFKIDENNQKTHKDQKKPEAIDSIYKQALEHFNKQDGMKDIETIKQVRSEYAFWESHFLALYGTFDDLYNDLMDIIEEDLYSLVKEKRLMAFPIIFNDRSKNIDNFNLLIKHMTSELQNTDFSSALPDNLMTIPGVNVRTSSELDYFFYELNDQPDIQAFIKQSMNTILLILKVLLKSKEYILKLTHDIMRMKDTIFKKIEFYDAFELINMIASRALNDNLADMTKNLDPFIQENYKTARHSEELVDQLKKKYFSVVNRSIITAYNDLIKGEANFAKNALSYSSHTAFLNSWQSIYTRQTEAILTYLEVNLKIKKIACEIGDRYDDDFHKPFDKSEKDDNLETDTIKTIMNEGFMMEDNDMKLVIKPVDVIVVNNNIK